VIISDLTGFVLARLDEAERDTRLFHELTCPALEQEASAGFPSLRCRCPALPGSSPRSSMTRDIIADCERRLRVLGSSEAPGTPPAAAGVRKVLGARTLDYELSPGGRNTGMPDQRRPTSRRQHCAGPHRLKTTTSPAERSPKSSR
jgi:hypothetical protein